MNCFISLSGKSKYHLLKGQEETQNPNYSKSM